MQNCKLSFNHSNLQPLKKVKIFIAFCTWPSHLQDTKAKQNQREKRRRYE